MLKEDANNLSKWELKSVIDGNFQPENDITKANFDIYVDVGPSSSSKRSATVRSLINMMQVTKDPETIKVLSSMAIMNLEGEGMSDLHDYFRAQLVRLGAVKPTEEEFEQMTQEMQNAKPDPNAAYLTAAAAESDAKAEKAKADTILTLAKSEQTQAKTAEIISEINRNERQEVIDLVQELNAGTTQPLPMSE